MGSFQGETEFWVSVKDNTVLATGIEDVYSVEEGVRNGLIPEDSIIDDLLLTRYVSQDLIVSLGAAIARCYVSLRGNAVSLPSPWCDKCCVVPVVGM